MKARTFDGWLWRHAVCLLNPGDRYTSTVLDIARIIRIRTSPIVSAMSGGTRGWIIEGRRQRFGNDLFCFNLICDISLQTVSAI